MKILLVDDERDIVELISLSLQKEGFKAVPTYSGEEALEWMKNDSPDLVILDLMLPGIQGLEVCRRIRSSPEYSDVPIIILSAKTTEMDRIIGLEIGADDYITKPFSVRELISRIRVALRRAKAQQKDPGHGPTFSHKGLYIDFDRYEVKVKGKKIDLSPTQMKLLFLLTRNPGRVYTRDQLLSQVWGNEVFVTPRNVDVHISRLRKFIEEDPEEPTCIVTVTSVGYKYDNSLS